MEKIPEIALPADLLHFCYGDDSAIRFVDPSNGDILSPNKVPECIACDRLYSVGFARLRQLTTEKRISVQLIFGSHGSAGDFDDTLHDWSHLLEPAPIIAVEAAWDWYAIPDEQGHYHDFRPLASAEPGRGDYINRQCDWLTTNNKIGLACEIDGPEDGIRLEFINLLHTQTENANDDLQNREDTCHDNRSTHPVQSHALRVISYSAYQNLREWAFIGQLGYWLDRIAGNNKLPRKLNLPFIVGDWHRALSEKFTTCGIPATSHAKIDEKDFEPLGEAFVYATRNAAMLPKYLVA